MRQPNHISGRRFIQLNETIFVGLHHKELKARQREDENKYSIYLFNLALVDGTEWQIMIIPLSNIKNTRNMSRHHVHVSSMYISRLYYSNMLLYNNNYTRLRPCFRDGGSRSTLPSVSDFIPNCLVLHIYRSQSRKIDLMKINVDHLNLSRPMCTFRRLPNTIPYNTYIK